MPHSPNPSEIKLGDPLSEVTRKERKGLLVASVIAIVIAKTGLIPSKISALGVEFGTANQYALLLIAQYIVLFLLIAFLVYALSDFVLWRTLIHETWLKSFKENLAERKELEEHEILICDKVVDKGQFWWQASKPIIILRCLFDFLLPVAIAIFAMHALRVTRQQTQAEQTLSVSAPISPSTQISSKP